MKFGLTGKEINLLKNVFISILEVEQVFIYGSRSQNTYKKTSDIDLAFVLQNDSKNVIAKLRLEMDELPIIYEIDLIDVAEIPEGNFKDEFERNKQLFYTKG
ncbi:MAG: nucleotidyltransferase domain-containing protein [bacterium]